MSDVLAQIVEKFPRKIIFPNIERPYRKGWGTLSDVTCCGDLSSRLMFGGLDERSFRSSHSTWEVSYGGTNGNGVRISVANGQFEATLSFLGAEARSTGSASNKAEFGESLNVLHSAFDGALQEYVESNYRVAVPNSPEDFPVMMGLPDGWSRTFLIPLAAHQLPGVVAFHKKMLEDPALVAPMTGSVHLQFNTINYVEGRIPSNLAGEMELLGRSISFSGTPLLGKPVKETSPSSPAAWTVRRAAYLYRCGCFMGDVPLVAERLDEAGLLAQAPDFWSALLPTELIPVLEHATWWSPGRECRMTWAGFDDAADTLLASVNANFSEAEVAAETAVATSGTYVQYLME